VNFTDDVPFSEEIFTRLSDAYRRLRNTLRILLGNLADFAAAGEAVRPEDYTAVDRWILAELQEVIHSCRAAYERLEFHRVYQILTQFCAVELSSQYVDMTKDRLYCDAANSPRRRATQATMREIFSALTRLLAPILVFTAEEAWGYFQPGRSVHLEDFPVVDEMRRQDPMAAEVREWLEVRARVAQAVEAATKAGQIGKPLEARVVLQVPQPACARLQARQAELEEFLILSHLELIEGPDWLVTVERTSRARCERCWRHREEVGTSEAHPHLCSRCEEAVAAS
jgi:isoleucyl-tRNA synthetase